jgi:SAM-dependent methyltransferase
MLSAYVRKFLSDGKRRLRQRTLRRLVNSIAQTPLDAGLHKELAACLAWINRPYAAHAVLRSAEFLRYREEGNLQAVAKHVASPEALRCMDHNQFYRFVSLANKVHELSGTEPVSLLDVGGGDGQLAQFLPNTSYFLAEPGVNGLSADSLPFEPDAFDYVVCCHVLEHIAPRLRHQFLDHLMLSARRGVILLNPFFNERTTEEERLQLFIDVMDAPWAREHLECTLPRLELVEEYARNRSLQMSWEPNGFMPLSASVVFMNHYCRRSGRLSNLEKINRYFNTKLPGLLDSAECPSSLLITLRKE